MKIIPRLRIAFAAVFAEVEGFARIVQSCPEAGVSQMGVIPANCSMIFFEVWASFDKQEFEQAFRFFVFQRDGLISAPFTKTRNHPGS